VSFELLSYSVSLMLPCAGGRWITVHRYELIAMPPEEASANER
jgi:hypothetical protein